jgi:hypothetical protein
MDEDFLYQLREQPALEFERKLRQDLAKYDRPTPKKPSLVAKKKFILILIGSLALLVISMATISPVKAIVTSLITKIAGLSFITTGEYPGHSAEDMMIEPQIVSLEEAIKIFPYEIHLPSYLPDGYIMDRNVQIYVGTYAGPFANTVHVRWTLGDKGIILKISDQNQGNSEIVAPESVCEEIMLESNHKAVLIQGGWYVNTQSWNYDLGLRLKWLENNLTYDLMGNDREQLIEIASSTFR